MFAKGIRTVISILLDGVINALNIDSKSKIGGRQEDSSDLRVWGNHKTTRVEASSIPSFTFIIAILAELVFGIDVIDTDLFSVSF